jgi:hypothetical protein
MTIRPVKGNKIQVSVYGSAGSVGRRPLLPGYSETYVMALQKPKGKKTVVPMVPGIQGVWKRIQNTYAEELLWPISQQGSLVQAAQRRHCYNRNMPTVEQKIIAVWDPTRGAYSGFCVRSLPGKGCSYILPVVISRLSDTTVNITVDNKNINMPSSLSEDCLDMIHMEESYDWQKQ